MYCYYCWLLGSIACFDTCLDDRKGFQSITNVQSNLAKGRIAILSPLAAANAFVHRICRAGTFASGGRRTVCNALMRRYVTMGRHMSPSKVPLPVGVLYPNLIHDSLDPHESAHKMASCSLLLFLHGSFVYPTHRQTDTQTTPHATFVTIGCIYALRAGDAV